MQNEYLKYEIGEDGIAIITIDQVNESANLFSAAFINAYAKTAQKAINDDAVKGIIVTSGKPIFMAGGDLKVLGAPIKDAKAFRDGIIKMHKKFGEIENGGKPFVAAINGTALGGGYELCLTCHHRIVLNNHKIKIGLPEAKVGLFPGGGGTCKLPYLLGIQNALMFLLQGQEKRAQDALKIGLVHDVAENEEEILQKAKAWIANNPKPIQPWYDKKYKIPDGGFWSPTGVQTLAGAAGNVSKLTHGNYPAQKYILKVVHDGLQLPINRALEIEASYFTKICQAPEAKNMIRTGFMAIQDAKKGKTRPADQPKYQVEKLGVLGAGMMGAGVAYVSAKAGMEVVLKDVSVENAEKGKAYSKVLLDKAISKKRSTPEKAEALLNRIKTSDDPTSIADCDFIVEAVFENPALKDLVIKETEAVFPADKIFGSNTSTIPITDLAKFSKRPENFIGVHFFSPVDKMPLVEIIVGEKTSDKAIAAALDYVLAIGKIPIVVNDSRGFFTSRCFGTFVAEGMFLLEEGVPAAMIENIAKKQGMAVGPLAVHDEVTLTLSLKVFESDPNINKPQHQVRAYNIIKDLVENHGRTSKKDGAGFYDYPKNGKKKLWSGLADKYNSNVDTMEEQIIAKRIMHRQALEGFRCLDEGVLRSAIDGDVGAVLGLGFPIYTGGYLSYIDYVGMNNFIKDCDEFKEKFGPRWEVPTSLRALAKAGKSIHEFK